MRGARRRPAADTWVIVPCMGRLVHLKRSLPTVVEGSGLRYCLVEYACPDRCGEWVRRRYPQAVQQGRIVIETVVGTRYFNKSRAHNRGAARAMREGARILCFLDADTRVTRDWWPWLRRHARADRFFIAGFQDGIWHLRGTGGTLIVPAREFRRSGGFDESFQGWGAEDTEMRLRLHLVNGLPFDEVPVDLLRPIKHSDRFRTRFYAEKDFHASYDRNRRKVDRKVRRWTGRAVADLPPAALRLDMVLGRHRVQAETWRWGDTRPSPLRRRVTAAHRAGAAMAFRAYCKSQER